MSLGPLPPPHKHVQPGSRRRIVRRRAVGIGVAVVLILAASGWGISRAIASHDPDAAPAAPTAESTPGGSDLIPAGDLSTPATGPTATPTANPTLRAIPTPTPTPAKAPPKA